MEKDADDLDGFDPVLRDNFLRLMGDMSVGKLRQQMAEESITIGTNAIQSARTGQMGLRLETLAKFAAFFKVHPYQFLLPDLGAEVWPFTQISADQIQTLPDDKFRNLENYALGLLGFAPVLVQDNSHKQNELPAPAPNPRALVTFTDPNKRSRKSGTSSGTKAASRKQRGG